MTNGIYLSSCLKNDGLCSICWNVCVFGLSQASDICLVPNRNCCTTIDVPIVGTRVKVRFMMFNICIVEQPRRYHISRMLRI